MKKILENLFMDAYLTQLNIIIEQSGMLKQLEDMLTVVNTELAN